MSEDLRIAVVIPALDEADSLPHVLRSIPRPPADRVVVVDNGSVDGTGEVARSHGIEVVREERRGYGRACLAGLARLTASPPDVVVFLDADYSDHPEQLPDVVEPILSDRADLVCGSRIEGAEPGALPPHVRWGNRLATGAIRILFGHAYRDMGPFRAIRWPSLQRLEMSSPTYGWNAEMQVKALQRGLRVEEVPVRYRRRIGRSKISGTLTGSLKAGGLILATIAVLRVAPGWYGRARDAGALGEGVTS